MRKTSTKIALWAIERYEEKVAHYENCIDAIRGGFAQRHIREKSVAHYEGLIEGALTACEEILHQQRCYYGFSYATKQFVSNVPYVPGEDITAHREYAEWRVRFITRKG